MVRRVVDTAFWTDMQVIDHYSIEDKYFSLYLMTNGKSTQVGIYPLPKKVMSFETGFTTDVIHVLLERFSENYGKILYSEQTQEVAVLHSLKYSILKGGKPVSDLLERELARVKDSALILTTYEEMKAFWALSKRKFDQTIQSIFEAELLSRGLFNHQNQKDHQNEKKNVNQKINQKNNHNEESGAANRGANHGTNRTDADERQLLERYANYLKQCKPAFTGDITEETILGVFYEEMIGDWNSSVEQQLSEWLTIWPKSLILEALHRSINAHQPISYAATILKNWQQAKVKTYKDVLQVDQSHAREYY